MFTGDLSAFILRFLLADFFAYHRNLLILPKNWKVIVLLVILIPVTIFSFITALSCYRLYKRDPLCFGCCYFLSFEVPNKHCFVTAL